MIKYKLTCKNCDIQFDSWFASSKEYEKLKKLKHLSCFQCNSFNVQKTLMSPSILGTKKNKTELTNNKEYFNIKKKIKEYQNFIKNNFEYVGKNFPYEVRSIHYNKEQRKKNIYGKATSEEIKELKDEGIETELIPWIKESEN